MFDANAQSAKKIHQAASIIDTHNDIPSTSIELGLAFDADLRGKTHSDLNRMIAGGVDGQIFSIFCDGEQKKPFQFANQEIDSVYAWVARNPSRMALVKNPTDLDKAIQEGKLAAMLGVEGGHMIEGDLGKLDALFKRGVCYMTLTWNNSTQWATSAKDETLHGDSLAFKGLTDFGRQVVARMNQLGMLIDVSHVGERTFWDVIATSTKPIFASHSCVWNLCPVSRNLKDDQIKAIAQKGGVIHLNFYPGFLDTNYRKKSEQFFKDHAADTERLKRLGVAEGQIEGRLIKMFQAEFDEIRTSIEVLLDHLDYIVRLVGVDHVGIGSDFDGIEAPPLELNGVENLPLLTKALKKRGYQAADIKKILGGNFIRLWRAIQP
jgi:membrane dipeptidase